MADYMAALKRARAYELETSVQLEHIERLHRIARGIGSGGRRASAEYAAEVAEKLARLEEELNRQIDRTVDAKREALVYISALEGEEMAVIYSYYILAKGWLKTADDLYMSERRVYLMRKKAFERLDKLFPEKTAEKLSAV